MGPDPVVVPAPVFGDDLSFLERIKDLAIQEFISQVAVKALAVAVFPRAPRHDVGRLRAHSAELSAGHMFPCLMDFFVA